MSEASKANPLEEAQSPTQSAEPASSETSTPKEPPQPCKPRLHYPEKVKADVPIEHWEKMLIGKKMVHSDEPVNENTFQKSDLPQKHWVLPGMDIPGISWDRLIVHLGPGRVCDWVTYR